MKKFKEHPVFDENPFIKAMQVKKGFRATAMGRSNQMVSEDGELLSTQARIVIRQPVDKTQFIKLYSSNIPFALPPIALKLCIYLLTKCRYNETKVFFLYREWQDEDRKEQGFYHSTKTIYEALGELLENGIIAKAGDSHYFVNPEVGFRGNRLDLLLK